MKNFYKKGFTLAELMIVFVVIGILAGVLVPIANNARPDEKVMKLKKSFTTLSNVTRELVTSSQYFGDNLSKKADNLADATGSYFCQAFADVLTTKTVNCKSNNTGKAHGDSNDADIKTKLDTYCKEVQTSDVTEILTSDNVNWYMANPSLGFSEDVDGNNFYRYYKVVCLDVDGIPSGGGASCINADGAGDKTVKVDICPFGFGVRVDGKIIPGARAEIWMEKSIQNGKKSNN